MVHSHIVALSSQGRVGGDKAPKSRSFSGSNPGARPPSIDLSKKRANSISKCVSFAGIISISNPIEAKAPEPTRNNRPIYRINESKSMDVLNKMGRNTFNISNRSIYASAENAADVIHEQAQSSRSIIKSVSLRSTLRKLMTSEDLGKVWARHPGDCDISSTQVRVPKLSLANDVCFSHTRSWIVSFTNRTVVPKPIQRDDSPPTNSLGVNTTLNTIFPSLLPSDAYVSFENVLQGRKNYKLQKAEPLFTDATGFYFNDFNIRLHDLNAKSSEGPLSVENYLIQSEKEWFNRLRVVKRGKLYGSTPTLPFPTGENIPTSHRCTESLVGGNQDPFHQQSDYQPPTGLRKAFLRRIGDWPIYSFFIAFVSILASAEIVMTETLSRAKFSESALTTSVYLQVTFFNQTRNFTSWPLSTS